MGFKIKKCVPLGEFTERLRRKIALFADHLPSDGVLSGFPPSLHRAGVKCRVRHNAFDAIKVRNSLKGSGRKKEACLSG